MTNPFKGLSVGIKLLLLAGAAVLAVVAYNFVGDMFSAGPTKKAEIAEAQKDAAIESGADATNTIIRDTERYVERIETVREIQKEVNNAEDIDSAHAAGSDGLCKNFGVCSPERVQRSNSSELPRED